MAIDASELARFTAEAIDHLESTYEDHPAELGDVIVIAEVNFKNPDGDPVTSIRFASTNARAHVQIGMLRSALLSVEE